MINPDTIFSFKNLQEKIQLFQLANWNIVRVEEGTIVTVYATWTDNKTMLKLGSYDTRKEEGGEEPEPALDI